MLYVYKTQCSQKYFVLNFTHPPSTSISTLLLLLLLLFFVVFSFFLLSNTEWKWEKKDVNEFSGFYIYFCCCCCCYCSLCLSRFKSLILNYKLQLMIRIINTILYFISLRCCIFFVWVFHSVLFLWCNETFGTKWIKKNILELLLTLNAVFPIFIAISIQFLLLRFYFATNCCRKSWKICSFSFRLSFSSFLNSKFNWAKQNKL